MTRPARKMKSSGIPWIGDVPADWDGVRLKNVFFSVETGLWGESPGGDLCDRICLRIADFDFQRRRFKHGTEYTIRSYSKFDSERLSLKYGDIVLEKSGGGEKTPVGRAVIFDLELRDPLFANFSVRLRTRFENDPWFVHFFLLLLYFQQVNLLYINQTTGIQNLNVSKFLSTEKILLPPTRVQKRIAEFLDEKCAGIDALIAVEEKMIAELKSYKQSVITEVVTRGVPAKNSVALRSRKKIPTKPTGIPWLGSIPAHWEIRKIKTLGILQGGNGFPEDFQGRFNEAIPFVKVKSLSENPIVGDGKDTISETTRAKLKAMVIPQNSIVFAKVGAALLLHRFRKLEFSTCIDNNMMAFIPSEQILPDFFVYVACLLDFSLFVNPGTIPSVNQEQVGSICIPRPDIKEQEKIVDFLDSKTQKIDSMISLKQEKITTLQNYKKSIIFEYVTGKKGL